MARKRATMREGPLAELFRKTEAAQRSQGDAAEPGAEPETDPRAHAALDETVEHVPDFAKEPEAEPPVSEVVVELAPEEEVPSEAAASRAAARYFQTMLEPAPQLHRVPPPKGAAYIAAIRVVGVGGAGLQRDPSDDGRGDRAGGLHRRQHRPAGARDLGRADEDLDRRGPDAGARLRRRSRGRHVLRRKRRSTS